MVMIFISGISSGDSSRTNSQPVVSRPGNYDAFSMCQVFVERRLKAPTMAKFAFFNESQVTEKGRDTYEVLSYVDAENSFGAMISTEYLCTTKYIGDDEWELVDLVIDE